MLGQFKDLSAHYDGSERFDFVIADFSNKVVFDYIAHTYSLGNFDAPGIFAINSKEPIYYYRNYETYVGPESFSNIGWEFIKKLEQRNKKHLSSREVLDFFSINLLNFEFHYYHPMKAFIMLNGFIAALLLPLLVVDAFFIPIVGRGPTMKQKLKKPVETESESDTSNFY